MSEPNKSFNPREREFAERFYGIRVDRTANDDTPEALKAAAHNARLVKNDWCQCPEDVDNIAYFRSNMTGHGWMCVTCRKIVQTG